MRKPWILCTLTLWASGAAAATFLPRSVAPEHGVEVLSRSVAVRWLGRELLSEPASSAVYGEVHLYDRFPFVEAHWVVVTSDAQWQRLLYGRPGEAPRAFALETAGGFGEPRGMAFAPDGRLFVADRGRGRLHVLRLVQDGVEAQLLSLDGIDGLAQPTDVAVDDGGTPADPGDDRILVVESGAHRLSLFALAGDHPVKLCEYGRSGPGAGEFLSPRSVAIGGTAAGSGRAVFVSDSGNHRLVRLGLTQGEFVWQDALTLPMEATSVDADPQGNLLLTLRRQDRVLKVSSQLEVLGSFDGGANALQAPRDVAVPYAWVHDHRGGEALPYWRGEGSALVLEAWREATGVRRIDFGVEVSDLRRVGPTQLELRLSDAAITTLEVVEHDGRTWRRELGQLTAGTRVVEVPELAEARSVHIDAVSLYDPTRRDRGDFVIDGTTPRRLTLHQNVPNPFNPATTITFELPRAGRAIVDIFDVKGRRVQRAFVGDLEAGVQSVIWNGRDAAGMAQPSGVYFCRLQALDETVVRKMVMAR